MRPAISLESILRRLFGVSLAAAVLLTVACYVILSHAHQRQLEDELQRGVDALLEAQFPILLQELVNDRYYAAATRGREIREETRGMEVGLYRKDGTVIYESDKLASLRARSSQLPVERTLGNFVYAQRAMEFAGEPLGEVVFAIPKSSSVPQTLTSAVWLMLAVLLFVMAALFLYLRRVFRVYVLEPLRGLTDAIPAIGRYLDGQTKELRFRTDLGSRELDRVAATLRSMTTKLRTALEEEQEGRMKSERAAAAAEVSRQVAHDIRSPLTALSIAVEDLAGLPEPQRVMLRSASSRISDIANNLLSQNDVLVEAEMPQPSLRPPSPQLVPLMIEMILSEKRFQFKTRTRLSLTGRWEGNVYAAFALVEPSVFKRVLSNLINNAVESIPAQGEVSVSLQCLPQWIEIEVRDDGKGIPPEVLPSLTKRGATFGKSGGSGLGLFFAKAAIEGWGGNLHIESEVGRGTRVVLCVPRAAPPSWFVSELRVSDDAAVVVVDDDETIHQIWRSRFDEEGLSGVVRTIHFHDAESFVAWVRSQPEESARSLFLMDYELLGQKKTGLDLIAELQIAARSILVTSRFEEERVVRESIARGVALIPKPLSGFVPIRLAHRRDETRMLFPDAVLLDDDPLVASAWQFSAQHGGKHLLVFDRAHELIAALPTLDKRTPIFIDSKLSSGEVGEVVAREVFEQGFQDVFLATGRSPEDVPAYPWIRAVVGKAPPWVNLS